jgi:AraC-binding-like domain
VDYAAEGIRSLAKLMRQSSSLFACASNPLCAKNNSRGHSRELEKNWSTARPAPSRIEGGIHRHPMNYVVNQGDRESSRPTVYKVSSQDAPKPHGLEYYATFLGRALIPMSLAYADADVFRSELNAVPLASVSVSFGTDQNALRTERDLAHSQDRSFRLLTSLKSSCTLMHCGRIRLAPGDLVLTDSRFTDKLSTGGDYYFINLNLPPEWLHTWVPHPDLLVGRRISGAKNWGLALSSFLMQLSPDFVVRSPVPAQLLADHVGALLALVASEMSGVTPDPTPQHRALRDSIRECIGQRCTEWHLTAGGVAESLGISTRTLHRILAPMTRLSLRTSSTHDWRSRSVCSNRHC